VTNQLSAIIDDLQAVERRLRRLHGSVSREAWCQSPAPGRWSPAQCVAHLHLTSETALPLIRDGLRAADRHTRRAEARNRRDVVGWLIWKFIAPANGLRTRTIEAWEPSAAAAPDSVMDDFARLQAEIIDCVRAADQLPISRVTLRSPFDERLTYNLYTALTLIPRHQQRHALQAERAASASAPELSTLAV
jgi:hypothetical protein